MANGPSFFNLPEFLAGKDCKTYPPQLCDRVSCKNLVEGKRHLQPLGGHFGNASKKLTYPIPHEVVKVASGLLEEPWRIDAAEGGKMVRIKLTPEYPAPCAPMPAAQVPVPHALAPFAQQVHYEAEREVEREKAKTKKIKKPATPKAQDDHRSPPSPPSPQPQRTPPEEEDLQVLIARHAAAAKAKSREDEEP